MKIVLHIGAWKTGSSAIQHFLRRNIAPLARKGVLVPARANQLLGHQKIYDALIGDDEDRAEEIIAEFAALSPTDGTAVISSEHFWPLRPELVNRVGDRLARLSDDVRVLLYVRPQDEMWASLYAQEAKFFRIKPGTPLWGETDYIGPDIAERALRYDQCLDAYRDRFGADRVFARNYARSDFIGGNVILDFLDFLGVEGQEDLHFDTFDRNPSLGWKGVAMSIWFGATLHGKLSKANDGARIPIRQAFTATISETKKRFKDTDWLGRAAVIFDPADREEIRTAYSADNLALFERYFGGREVFPAVSDAKKTPVDYDAIPRRETAFAKRRLLTNLWRAGLNTAPVEADLIENPNSLAFARFLEAGPIGWIERKSKPKVTDL